jgi:hypothetical protein
MRRQTAKQAAAFKAMCRKALLDLGCTENEEGCWYAMSLETIYGKLWVQPGEDSIRNRFDTVPVNPSLSGASFNPYSGKWNFEFSMKPTDVELANAIRAMRRIKCQP